jgi:hypothetical protein
METGDVAPEVEPLVARLAPDPEDPPQLIAVDGYLGKGAGDTWRLYSDLSLTNWLEVPKDRVRYHTQEATSPASVTILWVDREAPITFAPDVADLLRGELVASNLLDEDMIDFPDGGPPLTTPWCGPGGGRTYRHMRRTRCA